MPKPVILIVDDEPQVLNAVERDLRRQYQANYRIIKASSGGEALEAVRRLKQRDDALALFLADQRMPSMSGTEFLQQAIEYYPQARKVLLTAYADTQAAITSINSIGLDYYLMKPWDPPEQHLYPVLDDLLSDWLAAAPELQPSLRVAGTLWSPHSHEIKDFLARNGIPYGWMDIDSDPLARKMVVEASAEALRLPVVFLPDGGTLIQPDQRSLAQAIGMHTQAANPFYDLIIVGGGPAGLGAAVYGASEGLSTMLIERQATGGQAGTSSRIENYLGFPKGLSGADLSRRATAQALRLGTEILTAQEVKQVRLDGTYRYAALDDGKELGCRALVIATGVAVRRLEVPGVAERTGAGIYYGATLTEAANYRGKHVVVVGGANSAGQAAMYFSRFASQVSMLVRGDSLTTSMSHYLIDQIQATENIEVLTHTEVSEAMGKEHLEAITIVNNQDGACTTLPIAAMFIFVGALPYSDLVAGLVERDSRGFILTGPDLMIGGQRPKGWSLKRDPYLLETSVPGIFAAGDVRKGAMRRVASAVGEGALAVSLVHEYLKTV